ncbi:helix-turn-helix domain-containing protein [Saccharicrinis aurantiacus]|uniref:helix-turn-helix domain-containing protein n=1 Tax=Saccharicrinis aurantiacus TaxID=1849719 RepID=UPI000838A6C9|nr:helix-turn-helix transcriptional regulator [Saccharicrinis aurantiacus]
MLQYNFDRIFKARGIARPYSFLLKHGFSGNLATRIKNNKVLRIDLHHIEHLCLLLKCTPNDFIQWIPNNDSNVDNNHPLYQMKLPSEEVNLVKTINSIPLGKLEEIEKLIKESIKDS